MQEFNKQAILKLQEKIKSKSAEPTTEEATKQWLIMPLLVALGYDPYSNDIIPEYTLDVGTKKGEKVDYALQINGQPVAIIECKQFSTQLADKHISQLYRYFTTSDIHIAILTNGDEYWFFTDSKKENIMDLEPYYKVKISEASSDEIDKLAQYSKETIHYLDIAQTVQYERFQSECKELVHGLRTNNIPTWLLEILAERSGLYDIEKPNLAEYLYTEIKNEFNGYKADKKEVKATEKMTSLGERMKETRQSNKENMSKIKLNHEYVYNDYSDGNWVFHTIEYAIILGVKYEDISGRDLLQNTVKELLVQGKLSVDALLGKDEFSKTYRIDVVGDFRGAKLIEGFDIYIATSFSISDIVKFIQKLLNVAGLPDDSVLISFKN